MVWVHTWKCRVRRWLLRSGREMQSACCRCISANRTVLPRLKRAVMYVAGGIQPAPLDYLHGLVLSTIFGGACDKLMMGSVHACSGSISADRNRLLGIPMEYFYMNFFCLNTGPHTPGDVYALSCGIGAGISLRHGRTQRARPDHSGSV
jgi:hypothetical protein